MKQVHKEYQRPFLLEPTKLSRLVDRIHERLADHQSTTRHEEFEVFLSGNRREEIATLEQVLELENSRKRKIERLVIVSSATASGSTRPDHEIQVDFGAPKTISASVLDAKRVVAISVRSDSPGWAGRALSEVEEQVERTWLGAAHPPVALYGLLVVVLVFLLLQVFSIESVPTSAFMWLKDSDLQRIETMLGQQPTLTDENVRELVTIQLRNVLDAQRPKRTFQPSQARRMLFIVLPTLVLLACIVILLTTCYPSTVFLWGDEVDRYANVLQRRKMIWGIIIGVTVIGVSSKFLFEGISSWFPQQP